MSRVLVADDEKGIRDAVRTILAYEKYEVVLAETGREAVAAVEKELPDLVLLDIKMPEMDGLEALERIKEQHPWLPVIMISAHGSVATAVTATKKGAFDFLEKPLDRDRMLLAIRNGLDYGRLAAENVQLREKLGCARILGESPAIKSVIELVKRVAPMDARVMITGENGTGKELVARAVHDLSTRSAGPFVAINCAALPNELIESELFGHELGAFTGATRARVGKFEFARGGTILLDEVGDMPLPAQAKLLRVLEEMAVQRVGSNRSIPVDVRVISSTNQAVNKMIAEKRFREDLFFRLNVFPIHVPSLRERPDDVPVLAAHFLSEFCKSAGLPLKKFEPAALLKMSAQAWPGNVRQLRNTVERLAVVSACEVITERETAQALAPPADSGADPFATCRTYEEFKQVSERLFLEQKLRANAWNVSKTAEELDMPRSNLYKKLEKYGLSREPTE
ncbi:MAG: sigma-54 dependent transcriptional regulator [Planctomycetota bacterium]|nr:sigma-54 dependent transcriptional regulator [Planctomycetota bacterium]